MSFANALKKAFGLEEKRVDSVVLEREVVESIIGLATDTYPKEFIAFLEGKLKDGVLRVSSLFYQPYWASRNSTSSIVNFPIGMRVFGSVHSHPGPSNQPSRADLLFFSRHGAVHLIIKTPYAVSDIAAYDMNGRRISFDVA